MGDVSFSLRQIYPDKLLVALNKLTRKQEGNIYITGGVVRDYLLGKPPNDLDLVVARGANDCCWFLQDFLGEGAVVPLGVGEEESCRFVYRGVEVDIAIYRSGVDSLEADLALRDFTINALAIPISVLWGEKLALIDPLAGEKDLEKGILRFCSPESLPADPLRILRAFRFAARYGLSIDEHLYTQIVDIAPALLTVASERISYEFDCFLMTLHQEELWQQFFDSGVLALLLPELADCYGLSQPDAHHLDVYRHSVAAFFAMKKLLSDSPPYYFIKTNWGKELRCTLFWSALLHDIGKPSCYALRAKDGQITFYGHDHKGAKMVEDIGRRFCWSKQRLRQIVILIDLHMYPFHLLNVERSEVVTVRAIMRFYRRVGELVEPLFLLSLADSLASEGVGKPAYLEDELQAMYHRFRAIYSKQIAPVLAERLLGGRDLIEECGLSPGPHFSNILKELEELQAEGVIEDRQQALLWVKKYGESCSKCKKNGM